MSTTRSVLFDANTEMPPFVGPAGTMAAEDEVAGIGDVNADCVVARWHDSRAGFHAAVRRVHGGGKWLNFTFRPDREIAQRSVGHHRDIQRVCGGAGSIHRAAG